LAARAERVLTLEVDAGLVRALRAESCLPSNAELQHVDVLQADLAGLVASCTPPVRVVANLPYSISGPVLRRLLDLRECVVEWSVMLQREVATRLLANPGSRAYGSLSVLHRLTVEMSRALELSPGCFHPAPQVRSSFLCMRPLETPLLAAGELPWVERVVRAAFAQRRKTLVNSLRGSDLDPEPTAGQLAAALKSAGVEPRARAESLPAVQLLAVARSLSAGMAA